MNIKITYDWLLEYLETDADPYELQKYLSLCGPGVERVEKHGDDYVLEIEVTTNRVDMASVYGIAQEAQAILPRFGKKAKLKNNLLTELTFSDITIGNTLTLNLNVTDSALATRAAAVVIENIHLKESPEHIKRRLELCDVRSINNAIDITNYIMLSVGQPTHVFDYDKIQNHKMTIRESKKGEVLTTLDGKECKLPGGDIVIEDGSGALVDLCGIMGGENTAVDENTKNVILFIQTYDRKRIRKTSMLTGQRSLAATYFEKGLDEERVEPAMVFGIKLFEELTQGTVASRLVDIYKKENRTHQISVDHSFIVKRIGVALDKEEMKTILENLGFTVSLSDGTLDITVPFWRTHDIESPEDIVEEIARIYGYHNLPNNLPPAVIIRQPKDIEHLFAYQSKMKYFLKHLGLHESMNYSMVSDEMISGMNINPEHHLKLANTNSEELQYMRISLLPSIIKNIKDNTGKRDELKFFELSKVYYPHQENPDPESCPPGYQASEGLPTEAWKLAVGTNTSFDDVKGIMEALLAELKITYTMKKGNVDMFSKNMQTDYVVEGKTIGTVGKLSPSLQEKNGLKAPVYLAGFDVKSLTDHAKLLPQYVPVNSYATIKLDLTIESPKMSFAEMVKTAKETSDLLESVEFVSLFKNKLTLRFYFSSRERNITDKDAFAELEGITDAITS